MPELNGTFAGFAPTFAGKFRGFKRAFSQQNPSIEKCLRLEKLKSCLESKPHGDLVKEADYFCDTVKPLMLSLRKAHGRMGWAEEIGGVGKELGKHHERGWVCNSEIMSTMIAKKGCVSI